MRGQRGQRGSRACLLCRRQRRRCDNTCEFGRYFPADRVEDFNTAYRLMGSSNIERIMRSVELHERQSTALSILDEAATRRNDRVYGSLRIAANLTSQVNSALSELHNVNRILAFCRDQARLANPNISVEMLVDPKNTQLDGSTIQMQTLTEILEEIPISTHEIGEPSGVSTSKKRKEMMVEEEKSSKGKEIMIEEEKDDDSDSDN